MADDAQGPAGDRGPTAGPIYVGTAQVAEALGVSVATVKRWVDQGILPAHRTPGGHRKILLGDVLRIAREGDFPRRDLSLLGLPATAPAPADPKALAAALLAALKRGDATATRGLILGAHRAGMPIESLGDGVVSPTMARLGHEWEEGRIDVFDEHRGTLLCAAALYELKAGLPGPAQAAAPLALGGSPEGDPYLLANLLIESVLVDAGWEVINLGPNTPLRSVGLALARFRPRLLWLSVGHLADPESFLQGYQELYREAQRLETAVAIGGRSLTVALRSRMPYTTFGDGLTHLAAFARSLHPSPRRPRRGRPRGSDPRRA
ncbi:MAG TPA: helix-turn-helix domain-containing protein [Isosphaeraceae bacterium]